jgi:hypothetical protein
MCHHIHQDTLAITVNPFDVVRPLVVIRFGEGSSISDEKDFFS